MLIHSAVWRRGILSERTKREIAGAYGYCFILFIFKKNIFLYIPTHKNKIIFLTFPAEMVEFEQFYMFSNMIVFTKMKWQLFIIEERNVKLSIMPIYSGFIK